MLARQAGVAWRHGGSAVALPHARSFRGGAITAATQKPQQQQPPAAPADYKHVVDVEQFRQMGYQMVDLICDYMNNVATYPVKPDVQPGQLRPSFPPSAPPQPESWEAVKDDIQKLIMPGVMHWQSPKFFAYFAANTSPPGILAEMLIGALNMIGFSWQSSPISSELEMVMMDWLAQACGLPERFLCAPVNPDTTTSSNGDSTTSSACGTTSSNGNSSTSSTGGSSPANTGNDTTTTTTNNNNNPTSSGSSTSSSSSNSERRGGGVIQGTSSEAVLVAMLAARARALQGQPPEAVLKLVAYGSDQSHSCFQKACQILGLHHTRLLPATPDADWALQPQALAAAVQADRQAGLLPFFFLGTIGTTSSCAVDPIEGLGEVCNREGLWMHVDAAWAGSAALCPEQRHWFQGLQLVDSYSFNPHKWMLTTFDCCAMWVADAAPLKEVLSLTPVFLRALGNAYDYKDWQIPLGRRFRALKLWFVLRMYGTDSLQQLVRHHLELAAWFAAAVQADQHFELAAPPRFGLVCFRLKSGGREANQQLLEHVNASGDAFIIATELSGQYTLRFAIGNSKTQLRHVQQAWHSLQAGADVLVPQQQVAA